MDSTRHANQITSSERLLLFVAALPVALLSLGALFTPELFARLIGAEGAEPYIYRLVGAAALGYAAALVWALRGVRWARLRLLVAALLGLSVSGAVGALLQLLMGDTKGIVYLILALGLAIAALSAYLLAKYRAVPRPAANLAPWLVGFFIAATALAVPFALFPLFFPEAFGQAVGLRATDLLLYRVGGAELAGYVVLGIFEIQSRNASEVHSAAIMVLFFNVMAVVASLLALFTGESSPLTYVVVVVSGAIAILTFFALARRTGGRLFGDEEYPATQPAG